MRNRLLNQKTTILFVVLLFILSLQPVLPFIHQKGIISFGESSIYLNPSYFNYLSTWEEKVNFGAMSSHQPNIVLYIIFWGFLERFSLVLHPSISFIFFSMFLSGLTFYICASKVTILKNKFVIIPAALLYVFNTFRLVSPINERLHLLFIFMPLFFLFYHLLLQTLRWRYVFSLVILSLMASSMGANLPVFTIPYLLMFFYFIYYALFRKKGVSIKRALWLNISLLFLILLANLFWLAPLFYALLDMFKASEGGATLFSALSSGTFFDHFRFLGSWSWRSNHRGILYYPFSSNYYNVPLVVSTFLVVVVSFLNILDRRKGDFKYLVVFFNLIAVIALFMLAGTKGPLAVFHEYLYKLIPLLKIYREPFTKFMPLFIFVMSFNLVFSLDFIFTKVTKTAVKGFIFFTLVAAVLLNSYPLFATIAMPLTRWNRAQWGYLVKVPEYWTDVNKFLRSNSGDTRVLLFPYTTYGSTNNWRYGVHVAGNIADFLLDVPVARGWGGDSSFSGELLTSLFDTQYSYNLKNYLSMLNVKYVLQENDLEWRYSDRVVAPSVANAFLQSQGLSVSTQFGALTKNELMFIPNEETDSGLNRELAFELLDKPALSVYALESSYILPKFYATTNTVGTNARAEEFKFIPSFDDFNIGLGTYSLEDAGDYGNFDQVINFGTKVEALISPKALTWDTGWVWPTVNTHPDWFKYKLVLSKELLQRITASREYNTKVDLLNWLAAKRVSEIKKYDVSDTMRDTLIVRYVALITDAIDVLKAVPDVDKMNERDAQAYWGLVAKVFLYLESSEVFLNDIRVTAVYDDFLTWIELSANPSCGSFCYLFDNVEEGSYSLFVNSEFLDEMVPIDNIGIAIKDTFTKQSTPIELVPERGDFWSTLGVVNLTESSYKLNLDLPMSDNLLSSASWLDPMQKSTDDAFGLDLASQAFIEGYTYSSTDTTSTDSFPVLTLWNDSIKYKPIQNWNSGDTYSLSFDYSINGGHFGIAVVEHLGDLSTRKEILFAREITTSATVLDDSTCTVGELCYRRFEHILKARPTAHSADFYIYAVPELASSAEISIKNIEFKKIALPQLALKKTNALVIPSTKIPHITYEKLSPTKYKVIVKGASDPYNLVFVESFHDLWQLSYQSTPIATSSHTIVNGFANSWRIVPSETGGVSDYVLDLEFLPQKFFELSLRLSVLIFIGSLVFIVFDKFNSSLKKRS